MLGTGCKDTKEKGMIIINEFTTWVDTKGGKDSRSVYQDFSGGPVGKTPHSQCRGPRFDPWSGN